MTTPTPDTPETWGAASRGYAENVAPRLMRAFADEVVELLDPSPSSEALEVGAGSGAITEVLAPNVKSLLATDFAPKMVEILRERMKAIGATNVTCEVMDGQALALDDGSFDRAACCFALMLFPDRARGFSELRRVLRPGGRAVVSAWTGLDKFEMFRLFFDGVSTALPDLPPPPSPPPVFSLADPTQFKAEMEAAGFRDVEVSLVARDMEVPTFDQLWAAVTSGAPPVQMLLDRVGVSGRDNLHDTLADIVAQRYGSGPIRLTNVATVATGTTPAT